MRFRNSRVRTKVTALLLSLVALWAFAAWVTLREGVNLLWVNTLNEGVVRPSEPLLAELQKERRLTLVRLGDATRVPRAELTAQRGRTDAAKATFERLSKGDGVRLAASPAVTERLSETIRRLEGLKAARAEIDAGRMARGQAEQAFSNAADAIYRMYISLATLDDEAVAKDARTLVQMTRAREIFAQEDALLAGALAAGRITDQERAQFTQLVGAQRLITGEAAAELPEADRRTFERVAAGAAFTRLRAIEDQIMRGGGQVGALPVASDQWKAAADIVLAQRQSVVDAAGLRLVDRAASVALGVVTRLALAGGLGLVAVIASIVLSITTARALVRQLEKLRTAAMELANERLPSVVARLAQGEKVDVSAEAPPLKFGNDVIGQVGTAFNAVQETAIRTAVEEAQLRQSIRDILLSLARRTQSLVHRQLTLLDVMERRESEPSELKDLFRIDHLATRMRRNAENLIVLAGASPARAWRRSVPMVDVVRGALAEVEDFTRVTVLPMGETALNGRAVGDVIHLLAELIENAVSFSPPYTSVQVGGQVVASGYVIEIEDRGLGMSAEDLAAANERIANPPEFNLSSTARLGLYVVSRLAERHGIRVALKASPYGGTTAIVLLPPDLVVEDGEELPDGETGRGPGLGVREIALVGAPETATTPVQEVTPVPSDPGPPRPKPSSAVPPSPRPSSVGPSSPMPPSSMPSSPTPPASFTPSGLPFRVPQANLAPELAGPAAAAVGDDDDDDDRSPDEIRKIMGSFQSGTKKGRSQAAKLLGEGEDDQ